MNTQQATIASLLDHTGESFDQFFPGFLTPHYFPLYSTFVLFKFSSGSRVSYHVTFVTCFLLPHGSGRSCCCFIRDSLLKFILPDKGTFSIGISKYPIFPIARYPPARFSFNLFSPFVHSNSYFLNFLFLLLPHIPFLISSPPRNFYVCHRES